MKEPFDELMDKVNWKPTNAAPGAGLYATHEGVLDFMGFHLKVYTLNDGQRVFDLHSAMQIFSANRN